ncbi:recombinase family protein [Nocardia halotolerans]|uniref:Recombinase family protein n=1 Tax=Nocardia halotolerans TaxID=1755878 RepID=A0ABV8VE65_9NOCA
MSSQVAPSRALIVTRLSRMTDESTSPERQLAECMKLCADRGYEVVGAAEDLDVSAGKTSPFERPELKRWLAHEFSPSTAPGPDNRHPCPFDVIVFYRLDRLVRSVPHLWSVIEWAETHGVVLVSATEKHFDLSDKFGRAIVSLIATVAELELDAISERNSNAFRHNFSAGKWRGGVPPWGYLPAKNEEGEWRLAQDPVQVKLIREVVNRVMAGVPLRQIAHDLTEQGVLTPKDRFAESRGREVKHFQWHSGPLKRSLSSQTLLGHAITRTPETGPNGQVKKEPNGKKVYGPETIVRGDDGTPVVRAEPILSRGEFDRLQVELSGRENRKEPTKRSSGLLLRVIYCGACGRPAYRLKGGKGRATRYRCASAQYKDHCGNLTVTSEPIEDLVTAAVLKLLGDSERQEREWDPGEDHAAELTDVDEQLADLAEALGTGSFKRGTPGRVRLDQRIAALSTRREVLAAMRSRPGGWTQKGTGELFSDWWARQTTTEQNVYLRTMGVRVQFLEGPAEGAHMQAPGKLFIELGSLSDMVGGLKPGPTATSVASGFEVMERLGIQGVVFSSEKQMPTRTDDSVWFQPEPGMWLLMSPRAVAEAHEAREWDELRREETAGDYDWDDED